MKILEKKKDYVLGRASAFEVGGSRGQWRTKMREGRSKNKFYYESKIPWTEQIDLLLLTKF